jgi:hypothetical protein
MSSDTDFQFNKLTLGQLLKRGRLRVPPNQRSYAWREKQVRYLLQDLNEAIFEADSDSYFLGTVVIVEAGDIPSIVDGQQRLATTSILLARLRDLLLEIGRDKSAQAIDEAYLSNIDIRTEEPVSRIEMNVENNEFYNNVVLPAALSERAGTVDRSQTKVTNLRMLKAATFIDTYLRNGMAQTSNEKRVDYLLRWEDYINRQARVLSVFVRDEFAAYRMFETLNDRGLRASQVDILKNYLFSRCDTRLDEAKKHWTEIDTRIEPLGNRNAADEDDEPDEPDKSSDPMLHFFRHLWVTREGPTKAKDLAEGVRTNLTNEVRVLRFMAAAAAAAKDYVAISRPDDPKWRSYPPGAKQNIATLLNHLRVNQIKPLVFAIAHYLDPKEGAKALQLCVSWSVRFLIVGGRGGMLDTQYSRRAHEIGKGDITTARDLREKMRPYVPSDDEFEQQFAVAHVSRQWLSRYLIRAIEKARKGLPHPEYVENEDVSDVNLEHILPLRPGPEWKIDQDVADALYNLIGNQAIISTSKNLEAGNRGFEFKKGIFKNSGYVTTSEIAEYGNDWGRAEILDRQSKLAALAPRTWPLEFGPSGD